MYPTQLYVQALLRVNTGKELAEKLKVTQGMITLMKQGERGKRPNSKTSKKVYKLYMEELPKIKQNRKNNV